jgi:hypothetical protein
MTRAQRFVRLVIRILMPLAVLGSTGSLAGTLLFNFEQSRDVSTQLSPNHEYGATLVSQRRSCADGGSANQSTTVFVERRWGIVKTGLFAAFCVDSEPSHVRVAWQDDRTMRIECHGCNPEDYFVADTNWGKLRFTYDLDGP